MAATGSHHFPIISVIMHVLFLVAHTMPAHHFSLKHSLGIVFPAIHIHTLTIV